MSSNKPIIVKKIKKNGGGGHHGGAWKVAYADFVTAMMAFFLLLWLLNMTSDEKRIRLSQYFKHFSIYTEGGTSFMGKTSEIFSDSGESREKVFSSSHGEEVANIKGGGKMILVTENEVSKLIGESLKKDIKGDLGGAQDQVLIDVVKDGVRIQMVDKDGSSMFKSGSSELTPKAKKAFSIIGERISKFKNKVSIEGHTDAVRLAGENGYSNWELSSERASAARRELVANGLKAERVERVSGFAATDPLIKEDPADPRNRRISIILKITEDDVNKFVEKKNKEKDKASFKRFVKKPAADQDQRKNKIAAGKNPDKLEFEDRWNPIMTEGDTKPVMNKGWSPVLNEEDSKPVLNDDWGLAINKDKKKEAPKETQSAAPTESKAAPRKLDDILNYRTRKAASASKDSTQDSAEEKTIQIEIGKEDVQVTTKDNEHNSEVIEELSSPIVTEDKWSPVLDKDTFNK